MIGTDPLSRARTREAGRNIEFAVMLRIIRYVHAHKSPLGLPPNPAVAEQELQEWIDTGRIFGYIPKPMDLSEFRRTLRRAVDRYFENRGEVPFCA